MLWTIFVILFSIMGTGIRYVVHAWWVPPHPVDYCRGTTSDQSHSGTEILVAVSA
jgi:hypothetical protein